jgi:hypothetical protein
VAQQGSPYRSTRHAGAKGTIVVTRLQPGYVLLVCSGRDEGDLAEVQLAAWNDEVATSGFLVGYCDLRGMRGSAGRARELVETWIKNHRTQLRGCHVLLQSKIMEMVVAVILLATGTGRLVQTYSDVHAFERAIAREVPGFRRLPALDAAVE